MEWKFPGNDSSRPQKVEGQQQHFLLPRMKSRGTEKVPLQWTQLDNLRVSFTFNPTFSDLF